MPKTVTPHSFKPQMTSQSSSQPYDMAEGLFYHCSLGFSLLLTWLSWASFHPRQVPLAEVEFASHHLYSYVYYPNPKEKLSLILTRHRDFVHKDSCFVLLMSHSLPRTQMCINWTNVAHTIMYESCLIHLSAKDGYIWDQAHVSKSLLHRMRFGHEAQINWGSSYKIWTIFNLLEN